MRGKDRYKRETSTQKTKVSQEYKFVMFQQNGKYHMTIKEKHIAYSVNDFLFYKLIWSHGLIWSRIKEKGCYSVYQNTASVLSQL